MRIDAANARQWAYYSLFALAAALTFSISIFEIATGVFFGFLLIAFFMEPAVFRQRLALPLTALLLLYFAMNVASLSQTQYWDSSLRGIGKVAKGVLLCIFVFFVMDSEDKHKKIFECMLWATLVILIDAVIQGLTGRELILGRAMTKYYEDVGRVTATFVHANDFSAFLSVMLFFYLGALMSGRDSYPAWKRVVWAIGLILSFICLLWTYSRGAWFAVLISFVLSMLFRRNWKLIAAFAALLAAGIFFAPPALKQRFDSVKSLATSGTVVERKILWGESVRMIQKSPWLGLGVNTYARNEPLYKEAGKTDYQYAHNGYLQIGAEVGLLGLGAFMLIVLYFLFYAVPGLSASGGMGYAYAFGITAFLIHSAADTNLQSVRLINLLWLLWGLGFSYRERHS